jgi:long-subunit acyl-CoA synthetase (AMP-forming)
MSNSQNSGDPRSTPDLGAIVQMRRPRFAASASSPRAVWQSFLALGDAVPEGSDARIAAQHVDDVCTLIYTSGPPVPKAVMLSHTGVVAVQQAMAGRRTARRRHDQLPAAQSRGRAVVSLYGSTVFGASIWFAGRRGAGRNAARRCGRIIFWRCRASGKMRRRWRRRAPNPRCETHRALGAWAWAGRWVRAGEARLRSSIRADRLVFSRCASGRLDRASLVTGAAPISRRTLEFFLSLGLPVCEMYG